MLKQSVLCCYYFVRFSLGHVFVLMHQLVLALLAFELFRVRLLQVLPVVPTASPFVLCRIGPLEVNPILSFFLFGHSAFCFFRRPNFRRSLNKIICVSLYRACTRAALLLLSSPARCPASQPIFIYLIINIGMRAGGRLQNGRSLSAL